MKLDELQIRQLEPSDYNDWLSLYRLYAQHYNVCLTAKGVRVTWGWLLDDMHPLKGLCCTTRGKLIGLAHYREMPSPLEGKNMGFLDDLIVHNEFRRNGIAEKLLLEIRLIFKKLGCNSVWWVTKENNYEARKVYDKIARKTDWALYEMESI